ncbi:hypothetical protein [Mesorhizobium sp. Cs1321R2N1]|uniref:hypothetical protein n=1 Tax=Mesorhizobium sp. Cs1321R2N1 TaxID=3015174 RepID=UPI00301DDF89
MRRFPRLTNGFSKKFENHVDTLALYTVRHNFIRIHETLKRRRQWPVGYCNAVVDGRSLREDGRNCSEDRKARLLQKTHFGVICVSITFKRSLSNLGFGLETKHLFRR